MESSVWPFFEEMKFSIAILASGDGTNAEAIMKYFACHPSISVSVVMSNRVDAGVLKRAEVNGIPHRVFDRSQFDGSEVTAWLNEVGVTHLVLAGFLWLIPPSLLKAFPDRIINIHPALLPKFGGRGMFGRKVHEAILKAGEKESGISIHMVNEKFDDGKILFQARCEVLPGDSAETLASRVRVLEHEHYPRIIERWILS